MTLGSSTPQFQFYLVFDQDQEEGNEKIKQILNGLPKVNYNLLKYIWWVYSWNSILIFTTLFLFVTVDFYTLYLNILRKIKWIVLTWLLSLVPISCHQRYMYMYKYMYIWDIQATHRVITCLPYNSSSPNLCLHFLFLSYSLLSFFFFLSYSLLSFLLFLSYSLFSFPPILCFHSFSSSPILYLHSFSSSPIVYLHVHSLFSLLHLCAFIPSLPLLFSAFIPPLSYLSTSFLPFFLTFSQKILNIW